MMASVCLLLIEEVSGCSPCGNGPPSSAVPARSKQRQEEALGSVPASPCSRQPESHRKEPAMSVLRILIADDHTLVRSGMRALLQTEAEFEVVGEAATGEQVVTMAATLQPDVIVMDLRMPGISGIEATRRILQANPAIRILVVTLLEEDDTLFAALRAGARGYVLKEASEVEVLRAIRAVGEGEAIFSASMAERLVNFFAAPRQAASSLPFPDLTQREREILTLLAQGR